MRHVLEKILNYNYIMENLPNDILELIFFNCKMKNKFYFSILNKEFYQKFGGHNILKYKIEKFLNNDYNNFCLFLKKYEYDSNYLNRLAIKSIKELKSIYGYRCGGFYDLRYIFELMMNDIILEDSLVKMINDKFYKAFYKNLKIYYYKDNKKINKINKKKIQQTLQNNFKIFPKDIYSRSYLKLCSDIQYYYV